MSRGSRRELEMWGKTFGHHRLKAKVCEAQGHTWSYEKPWRFSSPLQGKIRRSCSCCNRKEWGEWAYAKKKGWVFKVIQEAR